MTSHPSNVPRPGWYHARGARVGALLAGGTVTAAAVLLPRATSVGAQWLLSAASGAGAAAVAEYVGITYRGSAAVSLFAVGLAPVLAARQRSLGSARVRGIVGAALLALSSGAFALTFAFEALLGGGAGTGWVVAWFAATTVQQCAAQTLWAVLQRGRTFVPALVASVGLSAFVGLSTFAGKSWIVALGVGLVGALPGLALFAPSPLRRTLRYAWALLLRSIPIALPAFWGSMLLAVSVSRGESILGKHAVGIQALSWSLALVFNVVSQNMAVRALGDASEATRADRAGRWFPRGVLLVVGVMMVYAVFAAVLRHRGSPAMLLLGPAWAAATTILSDPLCYFFCPSHGRIRVAVGSGVVSIGILGLLLARPEPLLQTFGVFGPVGLVGTSRLLFVPGEGALRLRLAVFGFYALGAVLLVLAVRSGG